MNATKTSKTKSNSKLRPNSGLNAKKQRKATTKTNLSKRPVDANNLNWDNGRLRLEILSPQIVKNAAVADNNDKTASSDGLLRTADTQSLLKNSGNDRKDKILEDIDHLTDRIHNTKHFGLSTDEGLGAESNNSSLKDTMRHLISEGHKVSEQLQSISRQNQINREHETTIHNLEGTISKLRSELDNAKLQNSTEALLHRREMEDALASIPQISHGVLPVSPHPAAAVAAARATDQHISSLETKVELQDNKITTLTNENIDLRNKISDLNLVINKLKSGLASQEIDLANAERKNQEYEKDLCKQNAKVNDHSELRSRLQSQLKKRESDNGRLDAKVRTLENENKNLRNQLNRMTKDPNAEIKLLRDMVVKAEASRDAGDAEIMRLRAEIDHITSDHNIRISDNANLQKRISELTNSGLAAENAEQLHYIKRIELKLKDREVLADQLQEKLIDKDSTFNLRLKELENSLASLEIELAKKKRNLLDVSLRLEKSNAELEKTKKSTNHEISTLKQIVKSQQNEINQNATSSNSQKDKIAKLCREIKSKNLEIEIAHKKLKDSHNDLDNHKKDLSRVNELADRTKNQLATIQKKCSEEIGHKKALERQLEMAVSEIRKAEEGHQKLRDQQRIKMAQATSHLESKISKLNADYSASQEEVRHLERASRKTIDDLEIKLQQSEGLNLSLQDYVAYLRSMTDTLTVEK